MPVVLISRGTMSGVTLLVDQLHERTGARCVSRDDLVTLVNRHGALAQRVVERLGDAARSYEDFCELRRPYLALMRAALLEFASGTDDVIYQGYSGHLLLPPIPHFITVRICAPLELRVEMTTEQLHCDAAEAKRYIERDDEERVRWARFMYATDIRDPSLYDVCVNLNRTTLESACNILEGMMHDPDWQATAESRITVERLLVRSRIEAALATDARMDAVEASAEVMADRVVLTGPYLDDQQRSAVLEIARAVSGMDDVEYRCGFSPEFRSAPPWCGLTR